jgi:hypothetical protein
MQNQDVTLILAAANDEGLIFAADTKLRYRDDSSGPLRSCVGSKVTAYRARGGNLVIAVAGLWVQGGADELLQAVLGEWVASGDPISILAEGLATRVAQLLTPLSVREGQPNPSELLIGFYAPEDEPVLFFVSSGPYEEVPHNVLRAVGGDPTYAFTQRHVPAAGTTVDVNFALKCFDDNVSRAPSSANDYPIQLVRVVGTAFDGISSEFYGPSGTRVSTPEIARQIPAPFTLGDG